MKTIILITSLLSIASCATGLSDNHITTAITKIEPKLKECVQYHTLLNLNEQFRTVLSFRVSETGKPKQVTLSGLGNSGLRQCINKQVDKIKFNVPASKERLYSKRLTFKVKS